MKIPFREIFRKKERPQGNCQPTAFPIHYSGKGVYQKTLDEDYGVVFEDDGETGYFYATNAANSVIFDALQLYNQNSSEMKPMGEEVYIVWNPVKHKVGIFYNNKFQAVFDFSSSRGVCRTGFPATKGTGSTNEPEWDDSFVDGLQPDT